MELENILKIIDAVSESNITNFSLEEGNVKISLGVGRTNVIVDGTAAIQMEPENQKSEQKVSENVVKSPLVGIFYASASPDSEPFVSVGDKVKKGQTLGIIEAMKLMNEIESEYDGVVKEILIDNEQMAEFGQPLFVIG